VNGDDRRILRAVPPFSLPQGKCAIRRQKSFSAGAPLISGQ